MSKNYSKFCLKQFFRFKTLRLKRKNNEIGEVERDWDFHKI